jgi:hypothetical protein
VFSLVSISSCRSGVANWGTKEVGALAIRSPRDDELGSSSSSGSQNKVYGCVFDIPEDELASYLEREHRYKPVRVDALVYDATVGGGVVVTGSMRSVPCWTVVEQTDEDYSATMSAEEWYDRIGQYYSSGRLWGRRDILPLRGYLSCCIQAAWELGGDVWLQNILDDTLLADETTSIRCYVEQHPDWFPELASLLERGE